MYIVVRASEYGPARYCASLLSCSVDGWTTTHPSSRCTVTVGRDTLIDIWTGVGTTLQRTDAALPSSTPSYLAYLSTDVKLYDVPLPTYYAAALLDLYTT